MVCSIINLIVTIIIPCVWMIHNEKAGHISLLCNQSLTFRFLHMCALLFVSLSNMSKTRYNVNNVIHLYSAMLYESHFYALMLLYEACQAELYL